MFSCLEQVLEDLGAALDGVEQTSTEELRRTLGLAKRLRIRVELLETKAAALIAQRERHGDGGAGLLREHSGLSRSEAARNVRIDAELTSIPDAHDAVAEGQISLANAAKLVQAARRTSPDAVQGDPELIALAKSLPADEFAHAAQRWEAQHQDTADLAAQHRRNRRNRSVRFWNGDDGSVQMRGSFDAEMGARIQNRLRRHAEQLRQTDRRRQVQHQHLHEADAGSAAADTAARTTDQRTADALDALLTTVTDASHSPAGVAPQSATTGSEAPPTALRRPPAAEIIVRADLGACADQRSGIAEICWCVAEICGIGPVPPSTVERLACNSDVWIEIFGDKLTPLYETTASRAPTAGQRRALIARDGACIGCGAPPDDCEAHHILPWKRGGKTRVDNLVLVCWSCHDRIHDHNWQVTIRDRRFRLIPPGTTHPPNPAPSRKPKHRPLQQSLPETTPRGAQPAA
ncbi:HNH endonuclease [Candidatus Poriferisodalis sp.]|uniref:HNH endonuclease signature motif containing protein n=1 Tax=Candidatus Poriferisodalis sp. TaxID=3101277 RepID=UPI003B01C7AB